MMINRLRLPLVVVAALVVQLSVLSGLRISGVHPELMLALAVSVGLVAGPARGATAGFFIGLVTDLFLVTPFGLSALTFTLVGFGSGLLQASVLRPSWWLPPVITLAASAAGVLLYAVIGATLGQRQMLHDGLAAIVAVVALANAVLAPIVMRVVGWAFPEGEASYGVPSSSYLQPGAGR